MSWEQFYLDNYETKYNILKYAYSNLGYKHSEETKKKLSNIQSSPEYLIKINQKTFNLGENEVFTVIIQNIITGKENTIYFYKSAAKYLNISKTTLINK